MAEARKTSAFTWLVLFIIVGVTFSMCSSQSDREAREAAAVKAEAERTAKLTPAQKKQEAEADAKAAAAKAREEARLRLATVGARTLKKAMNNPDAFKLLSALVMDDGAVCYEFRGQNAFGAIIRGRAALSHDGKRFLLNTDDGFAHLWNSECAKKYGREFAAAIQYAL